MNKDGMEIKKEFTEIDAFNADVELENYRRRVETGALTDEEKEDREQIRKFLGF